MVKALIFDLMGTCADWFSTITNALETHLPPSLLIKDEINVLAMDWRLGFFQEIHARFVAGLEQEDIDVTHRRVLDRLLSDRNIGEHVCNEQLRNALVQSWHVQRAWPDSIDGLERLKTKFFVVVLANGTTRLQLDIVQSSGLPFHALFSSQLSDSPSRIQRYISSVLSC
ncbi:hypothetical protein BDZ89DRAFT_715462 [Hymenopellis radicata]|nr:hypothetical protein BDZ89DRAFT_715462 [Hymenopellis radicata]